MSTTAVLLLNADHTPIKVISWEKAVYLILDQKARLVVGYAGKMIRSARSAMEWPAVVALTTYRNVNAKVRFNRANLLARDGYRCAYCGVAPKSASGKPAIEHLTLDHVVPRAQSRGGQVTLPWSPHARISVTCWENVVCACEDCNLRKADRTPAQAGLTLRVRPRKPTSWDCIRMVLSRMEIPTEWRDHLPEGSAWGGYWDEELDAS